MSRKKRVFLIVIDGFGCGALPDAEEYGDAGANTVVNVAEAVGGIKVPTLQTLGLGNIVEIRGCPPAKQPEASFGKMAERASAKGTMTGYWEMMGLRVTRPPRTFHAGFPRELIAEFERRCGRKVIGNKPASGTEIIEELGSRQLETGELIVYTSADSVFQVAAHTGEIPLDELYRCCRTAREMLAGDWNVGRVIARPFTGEPGRFVRTADRRDFAVQPPGRTVVDMVAEQGMQVISVGKVSNILAGRGFTDTVQTSSDKEGLDKARRLFAKRFAGLVLVNLVDLDTLYGHRNDCAGYARALEEVDRDMALALAEAGHDDMIILTADHGCDPAHPGTDHSREYVPLLALGKSLRSGVSLGTRASFADVGATIAEYFHLERPEAGASFLPAMLERCPAVHNHG
ncbi:MAG: phosphopentomutase [Candidatus Hydrogenedentes bacterium]|nr:phosphopentomutase [Candidatus Hydrogenedentota bacterium]